jgi:hypothetical protein
VICFIPELAHDFHAVSEERLSAPDKATVGFENSKKRGGEKNAVVFFLLV